MRLSVLSAAVVGASCVSGLQNPHLKLPAWYKRPASAEPAFHQDLATANQDVYLTAKSKPFQVDGSKIPQVPFNVGESYAGTLPVSTNASDVNRLYFWFFPSQNQLAKDEIVIWLNGGPGCSSLDGLIQENGPFLWQEGTYSPKPNPYSWTNLSNIVWVDQPVGTGYSPAGRGVPEKIINEDIVAQDFLAFWKNFVNTFDLKGRKVYITGESYAGQYIPYISYAMLQENNTDYFNVKGIQINDPSINYDDTLSTAPAVMMLNEYSNVFGLNDTFMQEINERADSCGYTAFMENALQFPPKGKLPTAPSSNKRGCNLWTDILLAAYYVNPCFNIYHILDFCPYLSDVMGFPSLGWGPRDYFNQTAVKKAINAPLSADYTICGDPGLGLNIGQGDRSIPSALGPLPHVIEKTNNVIIGHGLVDFLLIANGSLATIQNMTWNGKQGFQQRPSDNLYVPYHPGLAEIINGNMEYATNVAGAGYLGTTHTERGLTFVQVAHSGHEIPQYVPGAAYRQLEFLLGRIKSLTQVGDFTTQSGNYTGTTPIY